MKGIVSPYKLGDKSLACIIDLVLMRKLFRLKPSIMIPSRKRKYSALRY